MGCSLSNYSIGFGSLSLIEYVSQLVFFFSMTRNLYDEILMGLGTLRGGDEFRQYYSLTALSDPLIGDFFAYDFWVL